MRFVWTALMTAGLLLAGSGDGVFSQPPKDRDKSRERLEIVTMWKLMEALDLDKTTADKIFEIRRKYAAQRDALGKEIRQDVDTLREKLREEPGKTDDAELSRLVKSVREKRGQIQSLRDKQYDEVSNILTPRQQAQMVVFFKDFYREIRGMIHQGGPGAMGEMGLRPPGEGPPPFADRPGRLFRGEGPPPPFGPGPGSPPPPR
jgi:Spy/CpxP family protein refolding chaperone